MKKLARLFALLCVLLASHFGFATSPGEPEVPMSHVERLEVYKAEPLTAFLISEFQSSWTKIFGEQEAARKILQTRAQLVGCDCHVTLKLGEPISDTAPQPKDEFTDPRTFMLLAYLVRDHENELMERAGERFSSPEETRKVATDRFLGAVFEDIPDLCESPTSLKARDRLADFVEAFGHALPSAKPASDHDSHGWRDQLVHTLNRVMLAKEEKSKRWS